MRSYLPGPSLTGRRCCDSRRLHALQRTLRFARKGPADCRPVCAGATAQAVPQALLRRYPLLARRVHRLFTAHSPDCSLAYTRLSPLACRPLRHCAVDLPKRGRVLAGFDPNEERSDGETARSAPGARLGRGRGLVRPLDQAPGEAVSIVIKYAPTRRGAPSHGRPRSRKALVLVKCRPLRTARREGRGRDSTNVSDLGPQPLPPRRWRILQ